MDKEKTDASGLGKVLAYARGGKSHIPEPLRFTEAILVYQSSLRFNHRMVDSLNVKVVDLMCERFRKDEALAGFTSDHNGTKGLILLYAPDTSGKYASKIYQA